MPQEKNKKQTAVKIILWSLTAVCMAVIFYFSSRPANISQMQSGTILAWLRAHLGDGVLSDFIVRKGAHFSEYAGFCFLLCWSLKVSDKSHPMAKGITFASLYAITDEVHQLFVEGRSCEARDWALDTAGAITGAIIFFVLMKIIFALYSKKRNSN